MKKRMEMCPWCHREVWVEPRLGCLYVCTFCGENFTLVYSNAPATGEPSPQSQTEVALTAMLEAPPPEAVTVLLTTFIENPFVRDLVDWVLAYLEEDGLTALVAPRGLARAP